jgi:hypothetical protein
MIHLTAARGATASNRTGSGEGSGEVFIPLLLKSRASGEGSDGVVALARWRRLDGLGGGDDGLGHRQLLPHLVGCRR